MNQEELKKALLSAMADSHKLSSTRGLCNKTLMEKNQTYIVYPGQYKMQRVYSALCRLEKEGKVVKTGGRAVRWSLAIAKSEFSTVSVDEYVYQKVHKADAVVHIPQQPIYFQNDNSRTVIGLFPQFATWSDNSVWQIKIIRVTATSMDQASFGVSHAELSDIISQVSIKGRLKEDVLIGDVVTYLKDYHTSDRISKKLFLAVCGKLLTNISSITE